ADRRPRNEPCGPVAEHDLVRPGGDRHRAESMIDAGDRRRRAIHGRAPARVPGVVQDEEPRARGARADRDALRLVDDDGRLGGGAAMPPAASPTPPSGSTATMEPASPACATTQARLAASSGTGATACTTYVRGIAGRWRATSPARRPIGSNPTFWRTVAFPSG